MHARGAPQWQSRRKISLGPVRRAHPASGATWNVQVVRGKMTTTCLWHACRALALGMALMLLGAGMATLGYYAEHLSIGQEVRGNSTIRIKNESRGFHLNNFSYVGPIVMGFGGFIVVAACVMTFEARDSAAKVVPARFKLSTTNRSQPRATNANRRMTVTAATGLSTCQSSQTNRWENHLGVFRNSTPHTIPDRKALTAALVHFSRALGSPGKVFKTLNNSKVAVASPYQETGSVSRSDSVPNLASSSNYQNAQMTQNTKLLSISPILKSHSRTYQCTRNSNSMVNRGTRDIKLSESFLHPGMLQYHRHALSVDIKHVNNARDDMENFSEISRLRDKTKRSDTARRHVLSRQKPIEKEEIVQSPKKNRRTNSDISNMFRKVQRCPSIVSNISTQTSSPLEVKVTEMNENVEIIESIETSQHQVITPLEQNQPQFICNTESSAFKLLDNVSSQSKMHLKTPSLYPSASTPQPIQKYIKRPDSLTLNSNNQINLTATELENDFNKNQKMLYRSNSSRTFKRPKPKINLGYEFDQIYFISSNKDDEHYDSIDVIDERRRKNFNKFDSKKVADSDECSTSAIYSEYCSLDQNDDNRISST